MARMAGNVAPSWCPSCRATPGPDCPDVGKTKRQIRRREDNEIRRSISRLWAEDWDSPEDSANDEGNPNEAE